MSRVVRGLTATAAGDDPGRLVSLALGLTEPIRRLDELAALGRRARNRDEHARCDLRVAVTALVASTPTVGEIHGALERATSSCGCPPAPRPGAAAPSTPAHAILDQAGLSSLLLTVDAVFTADPTEARRDAVDAVVGLALAAGLLQGLSSVLDREGLDGLVARIEILGEMGRLSWVGDTAMSVLAGPGGMPALPGLPGGLPGLPGGFPGWPPSPDPGDLDTLGNLGSLILAILRKRHWWGSDLLAHPRPWWVYEWRYVDWLEVEGIRCAVEVRRRVQALAAIPPPARPARATWSDGITRIAQSGACAGDTVAIEGLGFGASQPAGVVVLLPTDRGCRPARPVSWSDTRIEVKLPSGVVSGPIGFGDATYVGAYDAWAKHQNEVGAQIAAVWCAALVGPIPLVAPFGECPPNATVNRLRAGAPDITAFSANGETLAVVEPTEPVTLRWTVANADRVRIDLMTTGGQTFGGSSSLVDPVRTNFTLPPLNNGALFSWRYRLTATAPCGTTSREVTVVSAKRPALRVSGAEVTQGIQTPTSTVRLVERKPTVVRVTAMHGLTGWGGDAVPNVTGRIRVRRSTGAGSPWFDAANGSSPMAATPGASITVPAAPDRNRTNDTLNFLIPPAWCTGQVRFEIEVRVAGFAAGSGFAGWDDMARTTTGWFTFEARRTLELRYVRVSWGGVIPTDQVCLDTLRTAVPLLPTPTANVVALPGVAVQTPSGTADPDRDDLLDDFDDRHNCSLWEAMTAWLGSDCPDEDGTFWALIPGVFYRGRAFDIPSNVCFTPPSDGPYAAHELSHCLDQSHVGVMCTNGQTAQGGDPPSAWPNNAQLVDVPFDVTRNAALTLAGTGVWDVMTYCGSPNNTWPMPERWPRLWTQVGG